ncbi:hypothetical protein N7493_003135 [Penicillium malachiteum]|uniref:Uncharacterized protein n=1 Tax=Penicillium malachiteum TaxID=1324776 RepID=A0AAD6MZB5_9EURO|nr:hypothetical protein N7493_003135 [Penicillium malachiteum]
MNTQDTLMQLEATEAVQQEKLEHFIMQSRHIKSGTDTVVTSPWNTAEVGYFYPDNWIKRHVDLDVDTHFHIIIFYNVYAFVNQLRALVGFKPENVIRANIQSCLRQEAMEWFITELNSSERQALRTLPLEEGWFKQLLQRFGLPPRKALFRCLKEDLVEENTYEKIHNRVRNLQASGFHDELEQAMHIWRELESSDRYRGAIPQPEPGAPLSKLLRDLYFLNYEKGYMIERYTVTGDHDYDNTTYEEWCRENPDLSA